MSTAKSAASASRGRKDDEIGDPALVERLNRALGLRLASSGERVTIKELGEAAGLSPQTMTSVMNAQRRVSIAEAHAFAKRLGVYFAWLAVGEGPVLHFDDAATERFGKAPGNAEEAAAFFARREADRQAETAPARRPSVKTPKRR